MDFAEVVDSLFQQNPKINYIITVNIPVTFFLIKKNPNNTLLKKKKDLLFFRKPNRTSKKRKKIALENVKSIVLDATDVCCFSWFVDLFLFLSLSLSHSMKKKETFCTRENLSSILSSSVFFYIKTIFLKFSKFSIFKQCLKI